MHTDEYEISLAREIKHCEQVVRTTKHALADRQQRFGVDYAAAAAAGWTAADRVLSTRPWATADALIANLVSVYAAGASLVQVVSPDEVAQPRRIQTEKVTTTLT